MDKKEFVQKCGELLAIAKPNLVSCELMKGKEIHVPESMRAYEHYVSEEDYVVVVCENGYSYKIPVHSCSLGAIAAAIFSQMLYK